MPGTPRGKRNATVILQTPAKGPKNLERIYLDSDGSAKKEGTQGTDEDMKMSNKEGATGLYKEKAGSTKKKSASFNVAVKVSKLVELIITICNANFRGYRWGYVST